MSGHVVYFLGGPMDLTKIAQSGPAPVARTMFVSRPIVLTPTERSHANTVAVHDRADRYETHRVGDDPITGRGIFVAVWEAGA